MDYKPVANTSNLLFNKHTGRLTRWGKASVVAALVLVSCLSLLHPQSNSSPENSGFVEKPIALLSPSVLAYLTPPAPTAAPVMPPIALLASATVHKTTHQTLPLTPTTRLAYAGATITRSIMHTSEHAGIPRKSAIQLVSIFKDRINVARDIRTGDHFNILYQERYLGDKKISTGDIAAAEITARGKTYRAIRYVDNHGRADYYTPEGLSLHKSFLRFPLNYTRISSGFSLNRFDPVMRRVHPHRAVDLAAPTGTPIKATGDGKVSYAGRKNGYGNTVIIRHANSYTTLYAHMRRFAKSTHVGSSVKEGQVIGYVGQTGMATGPHVHYEFRGPHGVHYNPLTVSLPAAAPLDRKARLRFFAEARALLAQLIISKNVHLASNADFKATPKPHG